MTGMSYFMSRLCICKLLPSPKVCMSSQPPHPNWWISTAGWVEGSLSRCAGLFSCSLSSHGTAECPDRNLTSCMPNLIVCDPFACQTPCAEAREHAIHEATHDTEERWKKTGVSSFALFARCDWRPGNMLRRPMSSPKNLLRQVGVHVCQGKEFHATYHSKFIWFVDTKYLNLIFVLFVQLEPCGLTHSQAALEAANESMEVGCCGGQQLLEHVTGKSLEFLQPNIPSNVSGKENSGSTWYHCNREPNSGGDGLMDESILGFVDSFVQNGSSCWSSGWNEIFCEADVAKAEAVQGIESHAEALGCVLFEKGKEQKSTMKQYSWYHFVPNPSALPLFWSCLTAIVELSLPGRWLPSHLLWRSTSVVDCWDASPLAKAIPTEIPFKRRRYSLMKSTLVFFGFSIFPPN